MDEAAAISTPCPVDHWCAGGAEPPVACSSRNGTYHRGSKVSSECVVVATGWSNCSRPFSVGSSRPSSKVLLAVLLGLLMWACIGFCCAIPCLRGRDKTGTTNNTAADHGRNGMKTGSHPIGCEAEKTHASSLFYRQVSSTFFEQISATDIKKMMLRQDSAHAVAKEAWLAARSQSDSNPNDAATECMVCMSGQPDTVLQACHHGGVCFTCARSLKACPLCRKPIRYALRVSESSNENLAASGVVIGRELWDGKSSSK